MTQDQEKKERELWRKRQILEAEAEDQTQKEYKPRTRWILTCQQLGVCQSKNPRCKECED